MNTNDFEASGMDLSEQARSLLNQATEEWRSEVVAAARREAASRGSRTVDAPDINVATYELGLFKVTDQRRRIDARKRTRTLALTAAGLAMVVTAAGAIYYVSQRANGSGLDLADQIASVIGAIAGTGALLATYWALLQSKRAAMEAEKEAARATRIITAGDLLDRWASLEAAMQAVVGDADGKTSIRTVGDLFKEYALLAHLSNEEYSDLRAALQFRNSFLHGRRAGVDPTEWQQIAAIIEANTVRARSLGEQARNR